MPEQLTKNTEVTLQVLQSGGARCASGAAPEILTRCPAERFCKLPGGEVCVYGFADAPRMTQPGVADWQALAQVVAPPSAANGSAWLLHGKCRPAAGLGHRRGADGRATQPIGSARKSLTSMRGPVTTPLGSPLR
jgi:hypothetical protein